MTPVMLSSRFHPVSNTRIFIRKIVSVMIEKPLSSRIKAHKQKNRIVRAIFRCLHAMGSQGASSLFGHPKNQNWSRVASLKAPYCSQLSNNYRSTAVSSINLGCIEPVTKLPRQRLQLFLFPKFQPAIYRNSTRLSRPRSQIQKPNDPYHSV